MPLRTCTECVFEVEPGWADETGYDYDNGDVRVVLGPICPASAFPGKIDKLVETFRLSAPDYELVERRAVDRPAPGAELLAHRIGGTINRFELSIFWPIGDSIWAFRVRTPRGSDPIGWSVAESFVASYQRHPPIEARDV